MSTRDKALSAGAGEIAKALAKAFAEGFAAGSAAERERIKAILVGAHAIGREAMAQFFAFETEVFAEDAIAMLGAARVGVVPRSNILRFDKRLRRKGTAQFSTTGPEPPRRC